MRSSKKRLSGIRSSKLRLYEDLSDGIIDKSEYFEFRNSYTKSLRKSRKPFSA